MLTIEPEENDPIEYKGGELTPDQLDWYVQHPDLVGWNCPEFAELIRGYRAYITLSETAERLATIANTIAQVGYMHSKDAQILRELANAILEGEK